MAQATLLHDIATIREHQKRAMREEGLDLEQIQATRRPGRTTKEGEAAMEVDYAHLSVPTTYGAIRKKRSRSQSPPLSLEPCRVAVSLPCSCWLGCGSRNGSQKRQHRSVTPLPLQSPADVQLSSQTQSLQLATPKDSPPMADAATFQDQHWPTNEEAAMPVDEAAQVEVRQEATARLKV